MPELILPMIIDTPPACSAELPSGYSFACFTPDLQPVWTALQLKSNEGLSPSGAEAYFKIMKQSTAAFNERTFFVQDDNKNYIGCASLCDGPDCAENEPCLKLCGLAVIPERRSFGIGKALLDKMFKLSADLGVSCRIYADIAENRYSVFGLLHKFGFKPHLGAPTDSYDEALVASWQSVADELAAYENLRSSANENGETETMVFEHSAMFSKCRFCKIFEISVPHQSGDIPHMHDYSQIWYVTRGSCEHYVEGEKYEMVVGDAFLLPPKISHTTILNENGSAICCEFYMDELLKGYDEFKTDLDEMTHEISFTMLFRSRLNSAQPKFSFSRSGQQAIETIMKEMLREYQTAEPYFEMYLRLGIPKLLLTFVREYRNLPEHNSGKNAYDKYRDMVKQAIVYIDEHYSEPITLEIICRISMVSRTYFCYLFKLLTQQTFVEYLMNLRISKAMEMLRESDMSVIDISQAVGFNDSTHFSRTFKRIKGVSPREYRAAGKGD